MILIKKRVILMIPILVALVFIFYMFSKESKTDVEEKVEHTKIIHEVTENNTILSFYTSKFEDGTVATIEQLPWPTFWGGASYAIKTNENKLYLIDGGFYEEDGERIISYVKESGLEIAGWILTHPHIDHVGAFLYVIEHSDLKIDTVYYSPFTEAFFNPSDQEVYDFLNNAILFREFEAVKTKKNEITFIPMLVGDTLNLGPLTLDCLSSFNDTLIDVNGNSLVFLLSYQEFKMLFTGDMTEATLDAMLQNETVTSKLKNISFLQIPHHGYMAGIHSTRLYDTIQPKYTFLDCTEYEYNNNSVQIQDHVKLIEELQITVLKRFESLNQIVIY
ncbi:MAG: ComEC/Rec2 family competence protein [Lachnospiraceae bacterium]